MGGGEFCPGRVRTSRWFELEVCDASFAEDMAAAEPPGRVLVGRGWRQERLEADGAGQS